MSNSMSSSLNQKTLQVVVGVATVLTFLVLAPEIAVGSKQKEYIVDLEAFLLRVDSTSVIFKDKGIREQWNEKKEYLRKHVRNCGTDSAFLELIQEAFPCLRSEHVDFVGTRTPFNRKVEYYSGLSFVPVKADRVMITNVPKSLSKKIKPWSIVLAIDGIVAHTYLEERAKYVWDQGGCFSSPQRALYFEYRLPLRGKRGSKHRLFVLSGGKKKKVTVRATKLAKGLPLTYNRPSGVLNYRDSFWCGELISTVGYMGFARIDESTGSRMKEAIDSCPDVKGWIIDLRGCGGTVYNHALQRVVERMDDPTWVWNGADSPGAIKRNRGNVLINEGDSDAFVRNPSAVLIDAGTSGAAERMACDLIHLRQARVFGTPSAGSAAMTTKWTFPSEIATVSFPVRSHLCEEGYGLEYNGIIPKDEDIVTAERDHARLGLNSGIVRAEEYLLSVLGMLEMIERAELLPGKIYHDEDEEDIFGDDEEECEEGPGNDQEETVDWEDDDWGEDEDDQDNNGTNEE